MDCLHFISYFLLGWMINNHATNNVIFVPEDSLAQATFNLHRQCFGLCILDIDIWIVASLLTIMIKY